MKNLKLLFKIQVIKKTKTQIFYKSHFPALIGMDSEIYVRSGRISQFLKLFHHFILYTNILFCHLQYISFCCADRQNGLQFYEVHAGNIQYITTHYLQMFETSKGSCLPVLLGLKIELEIEKYLVVIWWLKLQAPSLLNSRWLQDSILTYWSCSLFSSWSQ